MDIGPRGLYHFYRTQVYRTSCKAAKTNAAVNEPPKKRTAEEIRRDIEDGLYKFLNTPGTVKCS